MSVFLREPLLESSDRRIFTQRLARELVDCRQISTIRHHRARAARLVILFVDCTLRVIDSLCAMHHGDFELIWVVGHVRARTYGCLLTIGRISSTGHRSVRLDLSFFGRRALGHHRLRLDHHRLVLHVWCARASKLRLGRLVTEIWLQVFTHRHRIQIRRISARRLNLLQHSFRLSSNHSFVDPVQCVILYGIDVYEVVFHSQRKGVRVMACLLVLLFAEEVLCVCSSVLVLLLADVAGLCDGFSLLDQCGGTLLDRTGCRA